MALDQNKKNQLIRAECGAQQQQTTGGNQTYARERYTHKSQSCTICRDLADGKVDAKADAVKLGRADHRR